jgi:serine/threonine protein kinase
MWQDVLGFLEGYRDLGVELRYPLVRKISKQLVQGLEFIHECGIIHNGMPLVPLLTFVDFHPKNLLLGFGLTPITVRELLAKDNAFSIYGDPAEVYHLYDVGDGVMVRVYVSQPICLFSDGDPLPLDDLVVKIADFGNGTCLTLIRAYR